MPFDDLRIGGIFTGARIVPPADPPVPLWPKDDRRPSWLCDAWRVLLADADGNVLGLPAAEPVVARRAWASRSGTRDL